MTLVLYTQSSQPKAKRRQPQKHIWDWAELAGMCESRFRIECKTPAATETYDLGRRAYGEKFAHISERVLATWGHEKIKLVYAETPRGSSVYQTELHHWVDVYPAAGGITSYAIDAAVNGHFCNKHLPLRALDRQTRSGYRHTQWYHGRAGVYQPGPGPYYPDAGPSFGNATAAEFIETIVNATALPQKFRDAACSVVERATKELSSFANGILRYEHYGFDNPDEGTMLIQSHPAGGGHWTSLLCGYGIRVRFKSPCVSSKREGWDIIPDFSICVTGPLRAVQFGPDVVYAWELLTPNGYRQVCTSRGRGEELPGFVASSKPKAILDAARLWAAGRIRIPVND
jgi:hypothetical protein